MNVEYEGLSLAVKILSILAIIIAMILILFRFLIEIGMIKSPPSINKKSPFQAVLGSISNNAFIKKHSITIQIISMVLISRVLIFIIGYISYALIQNDYLNLIEATEKLWNKWDAPHFLSIAQNGYASVGDERYFIVFFPLFPILVRVLAIFVKNYTISGFIISSLSLCIGSVYLYKLAALDYNAKVSMKTVFLFLIFPMSFFCGIVYTESLFIALTVLTFYNMRKKDWLNAGVTGLLASFTRNFGVLLLIPLFIEIALNLRHSSVRERLEQAIAMVSIPIGLGLYLIVNKVVTGDWLRFLYYQKLHWHNEFGFLPKNISDHVKYIFEWNPSISVSMWIPQVISFLLVVWAIFYTIKYMRLSYGAYMLAYLIIAYSPTWLISGPRYIMAMFPMYMVLASVTKKDVVWYMLVMASILLLGFYTIGFANGYHIM